MGPATTIPGVLGLRGMEPDVPESCQDYETPQPRSEMVDQRQDTQARKKNGSPCVEGPAGTSRPTNPTNLNVETDIGTPGPETLPPSIYKSGRDLPPRKDQLNMMPLIILILATHIKEVPHTHAKECTKMGQALEVSRTQSRTPRSRA